MAALVTGAAVTLVGPGRSAPLHAAPPADAVAVRAATHADFGRLVLEWPRAVDVAHERHGDRLVLRFDRPFDADLTIAPARLSAYLDGIEVGADGRTVVLDLAPAVSPTLDVDDGRIVVVDMRAGAERLELRTGIHEDYARIVLDWPEPIDFTAESDDGTVRIGFPRPLEIDAPVLVTRLPEWLRSAAVAPRDDGSELRLDLCEGVVAEVFKVEEDRVVVDLHGPTSPMQAASSASRRVPASDERDASTRSAAAAQGSRATPDDQAGVEATPPADAARPGDVTAAPAGAPVAVAMVAVDQLEPAGGSQFDARASEQATPALRLLFHTETSAEGRALVFAWSRPVGAAVLLRAGHLWTVFGEPRGLPVELPSFAAALEGFLGPGQVIEAQGGVAVRFALRRPLGVRVDRDGASWRIRLASEQAAPPPIDVVRAGEPDRLHLVVDEPFGRVRARDPEVGDVLEFWPLLDAARGLPRARRLVDLELLPTAQGIAWRALADGLRSLAGERRIELPTLHGPTLLAAPADPVDTGPGVPEPTSEQSVPSESSQMPMAPTRPDDVGRGDASDDDDAPSGPLDLARWAALGQATLRQRRTELMHRAGSPDPTLREAARLDLARLFLSQAMAAETLAVLGVMEEDGAAAADAPMRVARQGLAGAAELLMGRLEQARTALDHPKLAAEPEIALWRAALAAAEQDWEQAAVELGRSERTLDGYPPRLQLRLGLPTAMIALEAGNHDLARLVLARLGALDLHPVDRARVRFLEGLARAREGDVAGAEEIWRKLERAPDLETRVKAAYASTTTLLHAGEIGPEEALARLRKARPLWHGHPWEQTMLDGLAEVHLEGDDLPGAIRSWHELISHHPNSPLADEARERMQRAFVAALASDDDSMLGKIRAYALYRDFPELVPDGEAGSRIRRRLAGQLAELDLVAPAAALLRQVMEREPVGPGRAEVGADLAELALRQPAPEDALAALADSAPRAGTSGPLDPRRRLLEARALAALDRSDEALAVLDGADDVEARRLRAALLWQQRDWPRLIETIEPLVAELDDPARGGAGRTLSPANQTLLLQLAVAHLRQGDRAALERLRERFGAALAGQPVEPAFRLVMPDSAPPGEPDAVLAVAEAQLDELRRYLDHAAGH